MPIATLRADAAPAPGRDTAPVATKVALLATVLITGGSLVGFVAARGGGSVGARFAAYFLVLFSSLFLLRVAGQLVVVARHPPWLPPAEQWNLTPYRLLLPTQLAILGLIAWIDESFWTGSGAPVKPREDLGKGVLWFGALYAGAMLVRYAARMARRPEERWFGGTIPIAFHWVLAAYLYVIGSFYTSY